MTTPQHVPDDSSPAALRRAATLRLLSEAARIAAGQVLAWLLRQGGGSLMVSFGGTARP